VHVTGKRYIVYTSTTKDFKIWNLADIHLNSKACAINKVKRDIQRIKDDPYSFWVGGGDYAEYISHSDQRRFEPDNVTDDLKVSDLGKLGSVSMNKVAELLKPIAHKSLGLCVGNHETAYMKRYEQYNLHEELCKKLGSSKLNMAYSSFFDVVFIRKTGYNKPKLFWSNPFTGCDRQKFRFFIHHGAGGSVTPGGKLNKLIQFMEYFEADVYMIAHVHGLSAQRLVKIGANDMCNKLTEKERIGVITGCYLKTYSQGITTYGEIKGYRPSKLGAVSIIINPFKREMNAKI